MSSLIAKKIKHYRTKARFSQQDLAERMDLSRPTISLIEQNKRKVSVEEMVRFCSVFDVTPSELLEQKKEVEPRDKTDKSDENILELYKEYKEKFQKKPVSSPRTTNPLEDYLREVNPYYVPSEKPFYEVTDSAGILREKENHYE